MFLDLFGVLVISSYTNIHVCQKIVKIVKCVLRYIYLFLNERETEGERETHSETEKEKERQRARETETEAKEKEILCKYVIWSYSTISLS